MTQLQVELLWPPNIVMCHLHTSISQTWNIRITWVCTENPGAYDYPTSSKLELPSPKLQFTKFGVIKNQYFAKNLREYWLLTKPGKYSSGPCQWSFVYEKTQINHAWNELCASTEIKDS